MCEQVVTFGVQLKSGVSFESFETSLLEAVRVPKNWRIPDYTSGFRFAVHPADQPAIIIQSDRCAHNSGAKIVLTFNDPTDASKYAAFGPTHTSDLCSIAFRCGACALSSSSPVESFVGVVVPPPSAKAADDPYAGDEDYWDQMPEARG